MDFSVGYTVASAEDTQSFVYPGDARAAHSLVTGEFAHDDVYVKGDGSTLQVHGTELRAVPADKNAGLALIRARLCREIRAKE